MRLSRWNSMGMWLGALFTTLACSSLSDARANVLYNFNNGPEGWYAENFNTGTTIWTWLDTPSSLGGRWSVDGEARTAGDIATNFLYSPIFQADDPTVEVLISHHFNFATGTVAYNGGTSPTGLGQLQWRIFSSGTNWLGSPATYTDTVPTFPLPTPWFPLATGTAWEGISDEFASGAWKNVKADIPMAVGDVFQLRLVNAHLGPFNEGYDPTPAWEIDQVQVRAASAIIPEPGTLALAAIGGAAVIGLRLRRKPWTRKFGSSAAAGIALSLLAIACALAVPPPAKADVLFDFQINQNGNVPGVTWTESQQGNVAASKRWIYYNTGDKRWGVLAAGADSITSPKVSHLTSSTFTGLVDSLPAQNARISLAHNFFLPPSGTGGPRPISLGQLQYRLNNTGTWVGLPLSAYTNGGSVNTDDPVFGPSPFKNPIDPLDPFFVDQTAFVAPTYVTPTTPPLIPYVAPGGAAFVGLTDGWSSLYVPSQAFLNINTGLAPEGITSLQLRLTNASIGGNCVSGEGWNVRMLAVEFDSVQPPVPEPGTLALAVAGGGAACAARALRRRRSPAALEAE